MSHPFIILDLIATIILGHAFTKCYFYFRRALDLRNAAQYDLRVKFTYAGRRWRTFCCHASMHLLCIPLINSIKHFTAYV